MMQDEADWASVQWALRYRRPCAIRIWFIFLSLREVFPLRKSRLEKIQRDPLLEIDTGPINFSGRQTRFDRRVLHGRDSFECLKALIVKGGVVAFATVTTSLLPSKGQEINSWFLMSWLRESDSHVEATWGFLSDSQNVNKTPTPLSMISHKENGKGRKCWQ